MGHRLAEFQQAAVDHIVARLGDPTGSNRFLLADEVGLGKTIVARGVIDALAVPRRTPLKVVYLCSNSEIAEQNRAKLADGGGKAIRRVTELAFRQTNSSADVQLYAFTPGTSLTGGTGAAWERQLMLYLLGHVGNLNISGRRWRDFFRCGSGEKRWDAETQRRSLKARFDRTVPSEFQRLLRSELRVTRSDVPSIVEKLVDQVSTFEAGDPQSRSSRNKAVGEYRGIMQRIVLRAMKPDLVILDEVQRFKEVIDNADDKNQIASELFRQRVPVLILSATPYRLLTLDHEARDIGSHHHEDFFKTLDFLFAADLVTPARLKANLASFGEQLRKSDLMSDRDEHLLGLKRAITEDLRKVLCRTERAWYVAESGSSVVEHDVGRGSLPAREELKEFFDIHRGLTPYLAGVGQVTDFWKSAPSLLTFMDAGYALIRKLRDKKARVPAGLLSPAADLALGQRNVRLRQLTRQVLGPEGSRPSLWTRPTYTYHDDVAFKQHAPRKMLVFSGWRFVPKAISILVSGAAAARLPRLKGRHQQPLRFTEKSFHVFDACYPSWALAAIVNPRGGLETTDVGQPTADEVLQNARAVLHTRLEQLGVSITESGSDPLWQIVARLESAHTQAVATRSTLRTWKADDPELDRHRKQFLNWVEDTGSQLRLRESELTRLALIAVGSPAVSLIRAFLSVFTESDVSSDWSEMLSACFGELRAYFNKQLVQQVVRTYTPTVARRKRRGRAKRGYAERVLAYAMDHHLLAVLDEHTFLLREATPNTSPAKALSHYRAVWSLGRGARRTNGRRGDGDRVGIKLEADINPTHFALSFGEEASAGTGPADESEQRARRSDIRDAFNSPFWPFVLSTTSVGQEGLDFHLHCRDIFHWNLPSNPVDLEQREGRLNRRDSLAVRQSIARDWPIQELMNDRGVLHFNPWTTVFERITSDNSPQRYKHGLYPHWIYECRLASETVGIERHVAFYDASRDVKRYAHLKTGLALYRLVFGQANQEHLLGDLEDRLSQLKPEERKKAQQRISGYMLNLSPVGAAAALKFADAEATDLLDRSRGPEGLQQLVLDVRKLVIDHRSDLSSVTDTIETLVARVQDAHQSGAEPSRSIRETVAALAYLRNPYDEFFDGASAGGFDDDIEVLRRAL